jgi:hypothetical protein
LDGGRITDKKSCPNLDLFVGTTPSSILAAVV